MSEVSILRLHGEHILYPIIARYFDEKGFKVGIKISLPSEKEADLLAIKNDLITIVEAKCTFDAFTWKDSLKYREFADKLWFACPLRQFLQVTLEDWKQSLNIVNEIKIAKLGISLVNLEKRQVSNFFSPKLVRIPPKRRKKLLSVLSDKICRGKWYQWSRDNFIWWREFSEHTLLEYLHFQYPRSITTRELAILFAIPEDIITHMMLQLYEKKKVEREILNYATILWKSMLK